MVPMSGALRRLCACFNDSQLPMRMPTDFALLTRAMPAASSGASSPSSAASAASLRIADILIMIDDEPRPRSSRDTRHALTVALVKPGRGACWNHARNSSSAMLYTRFVIGEETLSSTSAFSFSHPAIFSTAIKSFILGPFNGHCRKLCHEHVTSYAAKTSSRENLGRSQEPELEFLRTTDHT